MIKKTASSLWSFFACAEINVSLAPQKSHAKSDSIIRMNFSTKDKIEIVKNATTWIIWHSVSPIRASN
ncbi:MAG: hypothetical protein ACI9WT_000658 [Flavobacterium sp.]|jgi:hypothetical protein